MEPLRGQCGATSGQAFQSPFFKVLSLMHLTLLLLNFKIIETIHEECSQAHESIHIKWMDSCIERVHADGRGAATGLVPRWFIYVSD
jgi:hypothetical protein